MFNNTSRKITALLLTIAMLCGIIPGMNFEISDVKAGPIESIEGTVTFAGNPDASNVGQILHDGSAGSTDIPGIQLDIFPANNANPLINTGSWVYFTDGHILVDGNQNIVTTIDQTTGAMNSVQSPDLIIIKSNDGREFNFKSIYVIDTFISGMHAVFEGFRDEHSTGIVNLGINDSTAIETFTAENGLTASKFQNVDEVRISCQDNSFGNYLYINNIQIGDPVVIGPTFTSGTAASYAENATGAAYTAAATASSGGGTVAYSISGGTDQAKFNINSSTGVVTFKGSPDYENPTDTGADNVYNITVTATDSHGSASQNVAITVTNINDVNFTTGDNADIVGSSSLVKSVTAGNTADITFTGAGYLNVEPAGTFTSNGGGTLPGGLYAWAGISGDNTVSLVITAQPGYTFDLSSFKYVNDPDRSVSNVSVAFTSGGAPYNDDYTVSEHTGKWTTINSFAHAVNDVTQVALSASDYTLFQDIEITDIKPIPLSSDATFDFEANTSPVSDDTGNTPLATVTQAVDGETISISSTGGKFVVGAESALLGDYTAFSGKIMMCDTIGSPDSTRVRVSLQSGYTFNLNTFGILDNYIDSHAPNSIMLESSSGETYDVGDQINYGATDHGEAAIDVSGLSGFKNISYFDFYANGSNMQLALDNICLTNITAPILSNDTGLTSVLGQTITAGSEAGTSGAPKTASISVANTVSTIASGDIVKHDAGATVTFYGTDSTFATPQAGSVNLTAGGATNVYIKVMAADNTTLYYKVTVNREAAAPTTYNLSYTAGANGTLTGTASQTVNQGANGTAVTAEPNTGYYFVNWSDGNTNATRTDTNVAGNISVTANFALNPPTAAGGVEYVDVTNVLAGATLKLYTTDGALVSSTYHDMGSGTYRFENVLPNSKWFYVTQTVGGEESVNSAFVNVTFRKPVATAGVESVDISNVAAGATLRLYSVASGSVISSSPVSLGGGIYRFENIIPDSSGFYVTQCANNLESDNTPFFGVALRTPSITGENKQITVSNVFTNATVSLYNSSGNLVTALSNVTGGTCRFTNVTPGSGYYVVQSINSVQSEASNTAVVYIAAPVFVGGTSSITAHQNPSATDISDQFYVNDIDVGQTLTWSVVSGPSHGTLSGFPATGSTNGAGGIYGTVGSKDTRIPTAVTYTPATGYTGTDSFIIQVSDGIATDTRTITVEVIQSPGSTVTAATSAELMASINNAAVSTINLNAGTTYQISGAEINRPLTINGNGAVIEALYGVGQSFDNQTIYHLGKPDGNGNRRYRGNIFWYVKTGGTLSIQNLTLKNAATTENAQGLTGIFAAILVNNSGNLSLAGVTFENFWFKNSKFMELNNLAEAQGLYAAYSDMSYGVYADYNCTGNIAVSGCTFGSTNAFRDAVHIYNGNSITIQNSTFTGTVHPERLRSADGYEYGIYLYGGNCTVTNNSITGYDSKTLVGYTSGGIALIPFNNGSIQITGNTISGNDAGVDLTGGWKNLEPSMVLSFNGVSMNSSDNGFIIGENLKASNTISGNSTANIVMHLDQDDDANAVVYYSQLLTVTGTNTLTPTLGFASIANGLIQSAIVLAIEKSEDNGLNWTTATIDGALNNSSTSVVVSLQPGKTYKLRLKMTHDSKQVPNTVVTGYSESVSYTTPAQHTLAYAAGTHGTLSGSATQTVLSGGSGTEVTAVPNTGYHFVDWSDGVTTASRTDSNVTGDINVTARFAINSYTLTYIAGANGTLTGTASQSVNYGASGSQITAVPNTGYHFVDWSDGVTTASRTDSNITGNISVTANFAINSYTLTYTAGANGTLTGTAPQSVDHGASGSQVTAVPNTGYHFVDWSDGVTTASRTDSNVTGNISVTANFAINSYTLTYTAGANGTLTGTASQSVDHGASGSQITAVPNTGYHFVDWSDGVTTASRTDSTITGNISVTANFAINSYTLTYTAGANGTLTGTASQSVDHGASGSQVTAVPNTGYHFVDWSDGVTTASRTDSNVTGNISVAANFGINSYTVSFNVDGGSTVNSQSINYNAKATKPADPTKTGYTFAGWYTSSALTTQFDFDNTAITADTTIFAKWNVNSYTVSFNVDGGNAVDSQSINYNAKATKPADPTKTGYTFAGWYKDSLFGTAYDFDTDVITAVTTIYAKWNINSYTVSFNVDGGSAVDSQSINYNAKANKPADPTKTGYTFAGWYIDSLFGTAYDFDTDVITAVTTIYAKWNINSYTVSFNVDGGSAVDSQSINYNAKANKPADPTKTGYTFAGWYIDSLFGTAYDFDTDVITVDTTIYAKWNINSYTVSFNVDGGSTVNSQSINYNAKATKPADPTKTGYTFAGWYTSNTFTTGFDFTNTVITAATTIYAKWNINSYTVSFSMDGGSTVGSQSINYNAKATKPADPTKTGYTFAGWYTSNTFTTGFDFTNTVITADTTIYAKWSIKSYTVSFNVDGGSPVESQSINYEAKATKPADPTKTGYTFAGWYNSNALTTEFDFANTAITTTTTVFAKWNINSYTVSFIVDGGSAVDSQSINYNAKASKPADPDKTGYTFAGWYNSSALTTEYDFANTAITTGTAIYAKWNINSYTVSFNVDGGSAVDSQSINYNAKATKPADPDKTGYTFGGWYNSSALTTEFDFANTAITTGTAIYAKWNINSYTVSFNVDGGSTVGSQSINYNAKATKPSDPTKTGYTFAGWYTSNTFTTGFDFTNTVITAATTIYAKWNIDSYTVSFNVDGGSTVDSQSINYNGKATKPADPSKTGYNFAGWYKDNLFETAYNFDTDVITADTTIYAKWNIKSYTVSFNVDGGSAVDSQSINYEAKATKPADPTKTGYTFGGWYADSTFGTQFSFDTAIKATTTVFAKWNLVSSNQGQQGGAVVLVNGKSENIGTGTTSQEGNKTVTTVTIDEKKLQEKLEAEGQKAVVTIPVNDKSDVVVGELNGQMVKNMENKQAVLEVKTEKVSYTLPAQQIKIDDVSQKLGSEVELKDIKVQVEIADPTADTVKVVENSAKKGEFTIVAAPVEFTVKCNYEGRTVEISSFNSYVERMVAIPEGIDPSKITTGIVVEADGTVRHVPTKITVIDGKYYAKINSLTNSTYSVVWHPLKFTDVADHWAKDAVNDMGSRMVVGGVGDGLYAPDRDITRAEFAAIMVKALGLKPGTGNNPFSDVENAEWYADFIETAYAHGIISGYGNGNFGPQDKITREQAMTMIAKAMNITGLKIDLSNSDLESIFAEYTDSDTVISWAKDSIAKCIKSGIVSGRSVNVIDPKDNITRAEVAVIVRKLLQKSNLI